jgi:hypothetical protein
MFHMHGTARKCETWLADFCLLTRTLLAPIGVFSKPRKKGKFPSRGLGEKANNPHVGVRHILDIRSDAFVNFPNAHMLFLSVNHHKTGAISTNESPLELGQVPEPQFDPRHDEPAH